MAQPLPRARPLAAGAGAAVVRSLNLRQMIEMMADLPFLRHRRLASRRPGSRSVAAPGPRDDAGTAGGRRLPRA